MVLSWLVLLVLAGSVFLFVVVVVVWFFGFVFSRRQPAAESRTARECLQCGALLPLDSPEGLCFQCLLVEGLSSRVIKASTALPVGSGAAGETGPYLGSATAPSPEELAASFPQLEILELLGQGGIGAVYKARQPGLDRLVALKILPAESGRDPAFAERFTREARALAKLNHPNIVGVHDFGQRGDYYYFVMEFVDGANLRQVMRGGPLAPPEALKIVPQICDALQFAHEEGVVHRDIKPENVLLDRRGRVKIADFGLAKLLGWDGSRVHLTASHQIMGTLHYMAPEQMERPLEVDHRADIYSLGVVFYELLTGELPLGRFPPPSEKARVDRRLDDVVLRTLEKEPARRFQRASDVKRKIEAIANSGVPPPGIVTTPPASTFARASDIAAATAPGPLPAQENDTWPERRLLEKAQTEQVRRLFWPGTALIAVGVLNLGHVFLIGLGLQDGRLSWPWLLLVASGVVVGILNMLGGLYMRDAKSYPLVLIGCIAAVVPCSVCWLGISRDT